eukprot:TRINITY_DN108854_c0_g1_i1.p1 TRINITY_DN108854_c0_g1~~TRINITY_DN108854_c0_g1_i1.p1  ORF type:complete len:204 (+),score=25.66 TRINITY_DN108854_c0_g1_i1:47-658(+)
MLDFQPGDHLWKPGGRCRGKLYDHHLIYIGALEDGTHSIIENSFRAGRVVQKALAESQFHNFVLYERPKDPEATLVRAREALGERYRLLWNNCGTFANRCARGGAGSSRQVRRATGHAALATATIAGAVTAVAVGLVTTHTVHVTVPAKGLWRWLGYTVTKTKTVQETHPLGVAAASGAGCTACLWGCFAAFRKDPLKVEQCT